MTTTFISPSIGYRKSEADKHILEIDPVTAPVVRYIFDLCLQGNGFRKIRAANKTKGVHGERLNTNIPIRLQTESL